MPQRPKPPAMIVMPSAVEDARAIFGLGGGQMVGTAPWRPGPAWRWASTGRSAPAAGLILAMSSTAIVLQTWRRRELRQGPVGEAAFGVLLFQDLAVIPLFALLPLLAMGAGRPRRAGSWRRAAARPARLAAGAGDHRGGGAVVVGGRYLTRPVFRFIAAARLREIFTASALLLVVAVAA
jgi:Kef-type K+ transport system membrane component KefB